MTMEEGYVYNSKLILQTTITYLTKDLFSLYKMLSYTFGI